MTAAHPSGPRRAGAAREALVVPLLFLTVALAGGFRVAVGGGIRFLPPSLVALVLALLLMGVLVQGRVLVPDLLLGPHRGALENVSGGVAIATLFAASAQLFNTITPEAGLLYFLFSVFYALLLWNTLAVRPEPARLLRSLWVVFGGAFVLKYIVIAALYDPNGGITRRVLMVLLEGVTLGALNYEPHAEATGYVAFFTVLLFMIGLVLLPRPAPHLEISAAEPSPRDHDERRLLSEPHRKSIGGKG